MNIAFVVATVAIAMFVVEILQPGRRWPQVAGWWYRAVLLNSVQVTSVFAAGVLWDKLMEGRGMWSLAGTATSFQVFVGYIAVIFIYYWCVVSYV